jgi:hypothetical protein
MPPLNGLCYATSAPACRIPTDGNNARYIAKPDGCTPDGVNQDTNEPCVYTPEMR